MAHQEQWLEVDSQLTKAGLTTHLPDITEDNPWDGISEKDRPRLKQRYINRHIANIIASRVVLICNYHKNGVDNYVGGNSFLELAAGYILEKPVYLLNHIPHQENALEIAGFMPVILDGNLDKLIQDLKE